MDDFHAAGEKEPVDDPAHPKKVKKLSGTFKRVGNHGVLHGDGAVAAQNGVRLEGKFVDGNLVAGRIVLPNGFILSSND